MSSEGHLVQGQRVTMPVEIRQASAAVAMYSVPAAAAQAIIDYSGLRVLRYRPGRAVCAVLFVDYVEGDLGRYHEFGIGFGVHAPGAPGRDGGLRSRLLGKVGLFVHRLPVDQAFTLEAGRSIWGFPKVLCTIDADDAGQRAALRIDDQLVAELSVTRGVPVPGAGLSLPLDAYTHMDGVLRRVPWTMTASGTRTRPGGARVVLGEHPWGAELATLGLPKHAMLSSTIGQVGMSFAEAEII